jgi:hypothetical protein
LFYTQAGGQYTWMTEVWTPELRLSSRGDHCHLTLVGLTYGNGPTLLEASNDLLVRVLDLALGLRAGYRVTGEAQTDPRVVDFLWEIGELAMRGGDLRERVLGFATDLPAR